MARKRGRPSKTPSSSAKKTPDKHASVVDDQICIDLTMSDEETLEDIHNLSPKKAEALLRNLDSLRARISNKLPMDIRTNEGLKPHEEDGWEERKKPSKEDIEKIDEGLRANDDVVVDAAIASSNVGRARDSQNDDTIIGESSNSGGVRRMKSRLDLGLMLNLIRS
ncbi:hypothetical protein RIF29_14981 [Crotalaria pallida]|uniref:Uncharacterized protein n=1 Tax=Crotalaria pallida TaxID=3830 RepID=A0AAN9FCS0_CROPI